MTAVIWYMPHATFDKNKNKLYEHITDFKDNCTTIMTNSIYSDQQCCIHIDDKSLDDFKAVLCILL